ncbi:MAG: TlpA family protein disulfide reductase [Pseudomonadota bacterium]
MVRWVVLLLVSLLGAAGCEKQPNAAGATHSVTPFPSISFMTLDGGVIPFESFRGKLVVLNIWATWCSPCRREMPALERLSRSLDPQRFAVIGLSVDEDEHVVREYLNDKGITFARFIDKDLKIVHDLLGVGVYPTTILIAPDGTLIGRMVGPRQWESRAMHDLLRDAFDGKPVRLEDIPVYAG